MSVHEHAARGLTAGDSIECHEGVRTQSRLLSVRERHAVRLRPGMSHARTRVFTSAVGRPTKARVDTPTDHGSEARALSHVRVCCCVLMCSCACMHVGAITLLKRTMYHVRARTHAFTYGPRAFKSPWRNLPIEWHARDWSRNPRVSLDPIHVPFRYL